MEKLAATELMGVENIHIGCRILRDTAMLNWLPALQEDDFASNAKPRLGGFAMIALMPLKSKWRGFMQGHKKQAGWYCTLAEHVGRVLPMNDGALTDFVRDFEEYVIAAATTVQYDAACELAARMVHANCS